NSQPKMCERNNCSCSDINAYVNKLQFAVYIPVLIIGTILNAFAMKAFFFSMKKYTEVSIYLINLSILDILLLVSLPIKVYFSQPHVPGGNPYLCKSVELLYFINMYGSIYTIVFISLDRYVAIKHPFLARHLRSPKKTAIICVSIWIFVCTISASAFGSPSNHSNVRCFHNMSEDIWTSPKIISLEVFGFLIPTVVILYCSIQIIRALLIHRPSSTQVEGCKVVIIRIVVSNLVVFMLSFVPSHLGIFLQSLVRQRVISDCNSRRNISFFVQVALCMANINCCLDSVCYYFGFMELRNKSLTYSLLKQQKVGYRGIYCHRFLKKCVPLQRMNVLQLSSD
uniref:G protein-coupled receptor 55 n=1 Tax=Leptobrachium leishanense TaxID=445787 RepID=A0A8C5MT54_9ANUR